MKHTITNSLAVLLLIAIGVTGCSKEETPLDNSDTTRTPITIRVTDGGYAASDPSAAQSRAVENEYVTEFTIGDQIGLYVVKPDGTIVSNNIPLTHNGTGWTGDAYWGGTGAKYFAYYPYQPALTGNLDPSASDAAGFFAGVVSGWKPAIDQSSYVLYTASDLMIGSGTASKQADGAYSLVLKMTHAMALVVIEMPTTKYTLSGDADYTWTAAAPDTKFYGFMPYSPTLGLYRYLVKPAQSGASKLMGSYKAGNTKEYEIEQNDIATANYAHYKVDGGTTNIIEKTHTLQAGDFYCTYTDNNEIKGLLIPGDAASLPNGVNCIGIVFKVGKDDSDDGNYPNNMTVHGYVVALVEDANSGKLAWAHKDGAYSVIVGTSTNANDWNGYSNYQKIKGHTTDGWSIEYFPAANACHQFGTNFTKYAAPATSSGWFLPSAGQLKYLRVNREYLSGKIEKLKTISGYEDIKWFSDKWYWSSSENRYDPAGYDSTSYAWVVSFGSVGSSGADNSSKGNRGDVRGVLAF